MVKGYVVSYKTLQKQKNGDEEDKKRQNNLGKNRCDFYVSLKQEKI